MNKSNNSNNNENKIMEIDDEKLKGDHYHMDKRAVDIKRLHIPTICDKRIVCTFCTYNNNNNIMRNGEDGAK